jgi:hypothetical protein
VGLISVCEIGEAVVGVIFFTAKNAKDAKGAKEKQSIALLCVLGALRVFELRVVFFTARTRRTHGRKEMAFHCSSWRSLRPWRTWR